MKSGRSYKSWSSLKFCCPPQPSDPSPGILFCLPFTLPRLSQTPTNLTDDTSGGPRYSGSSCPSSRPHPRTGSLTHQLRTISETLAEVMSLITGTADSSLLLFLISHLQVLTGPTGCAFPRAFTFKSKLQNRGKSPAVEGMESQR